MALNISIIENVSVSELALPIENTAVYQENVGFVNGNKYRLSFDSSIDSGTLKIYQGANLIFDSGLIVIGSLSSLHENIAVVEHISMIAIGPSPSP